MEAFTPDPLSFDFHSVVDTRHLYFEEKMSQSALEQFGAYRKARELFDLVVKDMEVLNKDPRCYRLIAQQVASADSIRPGC